MDGMGLATYFFCAGWEVVLSPCEMSTGASCSKDTEDFFFSVLEAPHKKKWAISPKCNCLPLKSSLPNWNAVFQPPFFRVYVKLWWCILLVCSLFASLKTTSKHIPMGCDGFPYLCKNKHIIQLD